MPTPSLSSTLRRDVGNAFASLSRQQQQSAEFTHLSGCGALLTINWKLSCIHMSFCAYSWFGGLFCLRWEHWSHFAYNWHVLLTIRKCVWALKTDSQKSSTASKNAPTVSKLGNESFLVLFSRTSRGLPKGFGRRRPHEWPRTGISGQKILFGMLMTFWYTSFAQLFGAGASSILWISFLGSMSC